MRYFLRLAAFFSCVVAFAGKGNAQIQSFELQEVRLLPSRFTQNMQRDSAWMMDIGVDRLLHSFRTSAGVYAGNEGGYSSVKKLGGWESLDCELRGHTTGHMLSACALMYASTGAECFKSKGDSLVAGLREVQLAWGNGYLSAFPEELIERNIRGENVWAPWYTLHKILAGLIDQYRLSGSQLALTEAMDMAGWAYEKLKSLPDETRRLMLQNEFGGVGEAWWNLYGITRDDRCKWLAEFFYHNEVIDPLKAGEAPFGVKHVNTFIPKVIAEARRYELTGDGSSRNAVTFFWDEMMAHHLYATGSLSDKEHFFPPEDFRKHVTGVTGETCCTYNMLRLARHMFAWKPSASIMDYYERALYNHILGGQDPHTGMISYFLPLKSGTHKVYSTFDQSFWCCVGSSFESHAKYGENIYFRDDNTLYVNLFIPSELRSSIVSARLETAFPSDGKVSLLVERSDLRRIAIRRPSWSGEPTVRLNGKKARFKLEGSGYIVLERSWKAGDRIEVNFPMTVSVEPATQDPSIGVVLRGPIVLARRLGTEGFVPPQPVSNPTLHNDYYTYDYRIPVSIPAFSPLPKDYSGLEPLYDIHGERYEVYWRLTEAEPALLDENKFVTEVDGAPVSLVTIKGGHMALQATNFGGRVVSLFVPDRSGEYRDVVLGHETIDEYVHYTKERFLGSCVGPVANRITNASFTIDGQTYNLDKNHGGKGTLHSGFKGLDSVVWDIVDKDASSVTFHYLHKDGEGGFPGNLDITMKYSVTKDDSFKIEYKATTDKTRPVNISNHPYFNFSQEGTNDDYIMYINGDSITGIDGLDVLDPPISIIGTPMDYRTPHRIGDAYSSDYEQLVRGKGFDHNYCINRSGSGLTLAASVMDPATGIFLEVFSDQPGLQVYSGQYMTGKEDGKYGTKLIYHGSITLETQNWPDAPNKPSFPDPYLRPGQTYTHTCIYKFSAR